MSRKKGPALYELISLNKPTSKVPSVHSTPQPIHEDVDLDHNVLTPGRSIRMSVGTIGVILAVGIALIVISYTMGFQRGSSVAREDYGNRLFEEVAHSTVTPKLVESKPAQKFQKQPSSQSVETGWGALESDPRVVGRNYFNLIETTKEGAVQLAIFCRQKGLETYAISVNNTRLYRVIALPGSVDPNDAVAKEVRSKIYAIGQEWINTNVGRGSDLKDAYQSLYKK